MQSTRGSKVTAVILTHNRLEGALRCCAEVLQQTRVPDEVIVVDNASTDDTAARIGQRFPGIVLLHLPENLGPAGGFAAGFAEAMRRGCDFIWAIDDDTVLSAGCLERLLAAAEVAPRGVIFPARLPHNGMHGVAWRAMLIPSEIVRAAGVPRADLFWHLEDTEYFIHRIRDLGGFRLIVAPDAMVWHGTHRPRRGFPGWKLYYQTRNSVFYRFHVKRSRRRRLKTIARIVGRILIILFREERGWAKAGLMLRGVWDGLRGMLGKTVDPTLEPRPAHRDGGSTVDERVQAADAFRRWEAAPELRERMTRLWLSALERRGDP